MRLIHSWDETAIYGLGERVRYEGQLYRCLQAHEAQASWSPAAAPSLWVCIDDPGEEWPEYNAPGTPVPGTTGQVYPAYMAGDKITFEGVRYVCKQDTTTFSPAQYPAAWEAA
ncbi:hypothetical protein LJC42_08405 [Eubacteriales bacterium OttesenSCG-928-K08]|nr:hypothetical protein [Eubacteriales bacterium OttesenSCG-928-K08]